MSEWPANLRGKFIVFDGPDGSGKSTQFTRFAEECEAAGVKVCQVREPGGTAVGEDIRRVLLDPAHADMTLTCEMLLYMASRAQLVEQVIRPALARGELVLADRFLSSTLAYQGSGGGFDRSGILAVANVAVGRTRPDFTVVFDVDEPTAMRRLSGTAKRRADTAPALFADRMERKDAEYQRRVRHGFLDQAAEDPAHYLVIDARGEVEEVAAALMAGMRARMKA